MLRVRERGYANYFRFFFEEFQHVITVPKRYGQTDGRTTYCGYVTDSMSSVRLFVRNVQVP